MLTKQFRCEATHLRLGRHVLLAAVLAGILGCNTVAWAQEPSGIGTSAPDSGQPVGDGTGQVADTAMNQGSKGGGHQEKQATLLETVVVTARKRNETAQNVPMSISVLSGERLERDGDQDFRDIGNLFAGVSFNDSNGQESEFSIRGLTSAGSGSDTSIGLYVDGVYIGSEAAASGRLFDLSNIQVMRGPQATLFGRNTIAGAINIVTRKPEPEFGGSVHATLGNYGLRQEGATLNLPIAGDRLMARVSVVDRKRDGYLRNTAKPGDTGNDEDGRSGRLHILANPTDTLKLLLSIDASHDNACDNMFKVIGGALYDGNTDPDESAWDGACVDRRNVRGYSLNAEQKIGDLTFTSITAYRHRDTYFLTDRDFTALPILTTGLQGEDRHFTQEFRLASPENQRLNWMLGAFLFDRHNLQDTILELGPGFLGPGNTNLVNAVANTRTRSYAVYASGELALTDALKMDLGLRYTDESKSIDYEQTATLPIPGFGVVSPFHKRISGGEWSPTLALTYALNPDAKVYGRIARGHKAGGFNAGPSSNPDQIVFQPETLTSYELGYKARSHNGRTEITADIYYIDYNNIQQADQDGAGFYISNAASARSYGAETQFAFRMGDHATVNTNLGYVDARYGEFGAKSGNMLARAPHWTGSVNLDMSWYVGSSGTLFLIPEVAYRSLNYVDSANTTLFRQRAHWDMNLRAGYASFDDWSITFWTRNATDQRYTLGGFAVAPLLYAVTTSPPRTYGIDFQWTF